MKKILVLFATALLLLGCKTTYLPSSSSTETHIKDSTVWNIKDSIRITERSRYRDFSWIGDTLKLNGNRSRAWAVADTLRGAMIGEIEEDPVEEKTKIIYKDRIQYRDSIRNVEVPIEITKEVKYIPKWLVLLSILGVISTMILGFQVYLKVKKKIKVLKVHS